MDMTFWIFFVCFAVLFCLCSSYPWYCLDTKCPPEVPYTHSGFWKMNESWGISNNLWVNTLRSSLLNVLLGRAQPGRVSYCPWLLPSWLPSLFIVTAMLVFFSLPDKTQEPDPLKLWDRINLFCLKLWAFDILCH